MCLLAAGRSSISRLYPQTTSVYSMRSGDPIHHLSQTFLSQDLVMHTYHAHPNSIMLKWRDFHPFDLEITVDMKNFLANEHKELLFNVFGIYL